MKKFCQLMTHIDMHQPKCIEIRIRKIIDWAKDKMIDRKTSLSFGSSSIATGSLDNNSHF